MYMIAYIYVPAMHYLCVVYCVSMHATLCVLAKAGHKKSTESRLACKGACSLSQLALSQTMNFVLAVL